MLRSILTIVVASLTLGAAAHSQSPQEVGHYLFVWAGDQANKGNDFLAVIDADPASPSYGKLITSIAPTRRAYAPITPNMKCL